MNEYELGYTACEIDMRHLLTDKDARIAALEMENATMYAAVLEASTLGNNAALRCQVELQRIARKDAAKDKP